MLFVGIVLGNLVKKTENNKLTEMDKLKKIDEGNILPNITVSL
jgi:hypothetical protein